MRHIRTLAGTYRPVLVRHQYAWPVVKVPTLDELRDGYQRLIAPLLQEKSK